MRTGLTYFGDDSFQVVTVTLLEASKAYWSRTNNVPVLGSEVSVTMKLILPSQRDEAVIGADHTGRARSPNRLAKLCF